MPSDSEMSGDKVRKRLLELLGTDEVCINDRDFMLRLQEKIQEEHQKQEELKLKHLQEQEKKRERKLILDGIVERKCNKNTNAKKEKTATEEESNEYISFEDRSFDNRPNYETYNLREKMRNDMERGENPEEEEESAREKEDGEQERENEEESPEGKTSPAPANEGENPDFEERGNETERGEGAESTYHSCSFLNRPYSARLEALIKEETYQGMLDIALELIAPETGK